MRQRVDVLLNGTLRHANQWQASQVVLRVRHSALEVLSDGLQRVAIELLLMAALIRRHLHVYTGPQIAAATATCYHEQNYWMEAPKRSDGQSVLSTWLHSAMWCGVWNIFAPGLARRFTVVQAAAKARSDRHAPMR